MKYRGHNARRDSNEREIIEALKKIGCEVTTPMGEPGMPDLLVSLGRKLVMLEIKTDKGKVNSYQEDFHKRFKGHCFVVRTAEEALEIMTKQD